MNNPRLLAGVLCALLLSGGVRSYGSSVITLEEIFECAEANSAQLRPAKTDESLAKSAISVARSQWLPDINTSLSVSYIGDGFTTKRNFSDYQKAPIPHLGTGLGLNISQPIFTGGAITSAIELAELKLTAARFAADLQRDNIRFELTGLYLDIYKYKNLRNVVESNIASARKVLDEMQARVLQGTALNNDITRYELLISNLELRLIKIDNLLQILNTNLVTIAGLPANTLIDPDPQILTRSLLAGNEDYWQREALDNAPSIALAQKGVEITSKAESLVKADRLPKIGFNAGWTMDGPILVEVPPINRNLSYWYAGIGVSYNLSSLYKTNKSLAESRIASQKARQELEVASQRTALAVNADYIGYLEALEELKTMEKSVELAESNYSITSTRFSEGISLLTDMLDAADSRLNSQQQLVNAKINIIYQYYKLLFSTGKI